MNTIYGPTCVCVMSDCRDEPFKHLLVNNSAPPIWNFSWPPWPWPCHLSARMGRTDRQMRGWQGSVLPLSV